MYGTTRYDIKTFQECIYVLPYSGPRIRIHIRNKPLANKLTLPHDRLNLVILGAPSFAGRISAARTGFDGVLLHIRTYIQLDTEIAPGTVCSEMHLLNGTSIFLPRSFFLFFPFPHQQQ